MANEGTLFLDEVGDLSIVAQAKLLRVLEDHRFERLGGNQSIQVDFRLISATNRPLDLFVRDGRFREDLFYRVNAFAIRLPSLRERPVDIPVLAQRFLARYCAANGLPLDAKDAVEGRGRCARRLPVAGQHPRARKHVSRAALSAPGRTIRGADVEFLHVAPPRRRPVAGPDRMPTLAESSARTSRASSRRPAGTRRKPRASSTCRAARCTARSAVSLQFQSTAVDACVVPAQHAPMCRRARPRRLRRCAGKCLPMNERGSHPVNSRAGSRLARPRSWRPTAMSLALCATHDEACSLDGGTARPPRFRDDPIAAGVYPGLVVAVAAGIAVYELPRLPSDSSVVTGLLLVAAVVAAALRAPLTIGGWRASLSAGHAVALVSLAFVGPAAAMVVAAVAGAVHGLLSSGSACRWRRAPFAAAVAMLSVAAAGLVYAAAGSGTTAVETGLAGRALPLAAASLAQLLVNTLLVGGAVALTDRSVPPIPLDDAAWLGLSWVVGTSAVLGGVALRAGDSPATAAFLVAPLLVAHAAYGCARTRLARADRRADDTSRLHMATIEALALAIDAKDQTGTPSTSGACRSSRPAWPGRSG
jgi:hypothetical protein